LTNVTRGRGLSVVVDEVELDVDVLRLVVVWVVVFIQAIVVVLDEVEDDVEVLVVVWVSSAMITSGSSSYSYIYPSP